MLPPMKPRCIIKPDNLLKQIWDALVNQVFIVSFFLTPLNLAFQLELFEDFSTIELIFDIVLFIDIVLSFFTAFYIDVELITDRKKIACSYAKKYLFFDALATLPGLISLENVPSLYFMKIVRYIYMGRLFDQFRLMFTKIADAIHSVSRTFTNNLYKMLKMMITLMLVIHAFGCLWIYLGITTEGGWLDGADYLHDHNRVYVEAFYFMIETFTTVGYGDFGAGSNEEVWFLMIMELLGVIVFSTMMGNLTSLEMAHTAESIIN